MKILFLTRLFYPHIGGVERHVMEVTKRLEALGHTVTIITEELHGTQALQGATSMGEYINATIYRIPVGENEKQKKFLIWKWLRLHRNLMEEADVIHAHDVFFWYLPFRFRHPRKKVYTTFHGYETKFPPAKNAITVRKLSERLSRGNICVGDFITKWYGTRPDFVTYGGVETFPLSDIQYQIPNKKLRVLFLGRIEKDTGVAEYAKVLELMKKNNVEFTFTALGEGSQKEIFREFGNVPGVIGNVRPYLQKADVVFVSSYLSMLEALHEKKLIIATYANDLKKDYLLMSPFGKYIIAEATAEKAFEKLKFFILNPNRLKKMISDGQSWADQQTWDEVTNLYLRLWKK